MTPDLSNGGVVAILGNIRVQEYLSHAQVVHCTSHEEIPSNVKLIIMAPDLMTMEKQWVFALHRQKGTPYLVRNSNQAVYQELKKLFGEKPKVTVEEIKEVQTKGKLKQLIEYIDFSKSNAENAKILLRIANEKGIASTEGSLAQFVANKRREQGGTAVVKSARSKLDVSVEMLDDAIKGLTDMRDYLIATVEENRILKAKLERLTKALTE